MIVLVYGTRPEAIKLGPVAAALRTRHAEFRVLATGQHTSLLAGTPAETDLADGLSLGLPSTGDIGCWLLQAVPLLKTALKQLDASLVVVQGDTMSALAGAQAARDAYIPVAHVEAGLRSGDLSDPWPEEQCRREITRIATWHCAPTAGARQHLLDEGVPTGRIVVTGNPVVSAIARYSDVWPVHAPDPLILFTMHRREWLREGVDDVLAGLVASATQYPEITLCWPMHPTVEHRLPADWLASVPSNLQVVLPLTYGATLTLLSRSVGVATDSGGLVEEAATLGVPAAILRHVCDRPESLDAGTARLFPPTGDGVCQALTALVDRQIRRQPLNLYGTVESADHIADCLLNWSPISKNVPSVPRGVPADRCGAEGGRPV